MSINLLSPKQVAEMFSVEPKTILKWNKLKRLTGIRFNKRVIRFDPAHINQVIESATMNPSPTTGKIGDSK